jgi:hypothetical protein
MNTRIIIGELEMRSFSRIEPTAQLKTLIRIIVSFVLFSIFVSVGQVGAVT